MKLGGIVLVGLLILSGALWVRSSADDVIGAAPQSREQRERDAGRHSEPRASPPATSGPAEQVEHVMGDAPPRPAKPHIDTGKSLEQTKAAGLLAILHSDKSESERADAILRLMATSGAAEPKFAEAGHSIASQLSERQLITTDWNCYGAGCYFRIPDGASRQDAVSEFNKARAKLAPNSILIITGTTTGNELGLLVDAE